MERSVEAAIAEPERTGTTAVDGGRQLAWAEWGPVDGTPVLFFSGAAMGCRLGFGADVVADLGIRLVAVDRPGIGRSDPDPDRTLSTWVDDVRALGSARGLGAPPIVAFSQGSPFALACAAAGAAPALALVSGQDDLSYPPITAMLPAEAAALVRSVADDPGGVEATFGRIADADAIWRLVTDMSSEVDRARYTSPAFATAYRRSLDDGFAQGAAAYARDLVLAMGAWPFDVADIEVPVDLWYGGLDANPTHSPDGATTLARRLPRARHHLVPDAGGSLLWTHGEEILRLLLA